MTDVYSALLAACREFVRKVETGEARSVHSYAQMKAAIALAEAHPAYDAEQDNPRGLVDGVFYCYGGCGTSYTDFPCDLLLPTALWNEIAIGLPFVADDGDGDKGRMGLLCPACIINRLAKLPRCTVVFADLDDHRPDHQMEQRERAQSAVSLDAMQDLVWEIQDRERDLVHDAATLRDEADHGGPFDARILQYEKAASELETFADKLDALRRAFNVEEPQS